MKAEYLEYNSYLKEITRNVKTHNKDYRGSENGWYRFAVKYSGQRKSEQSL